MLRHAPEDADADVEAPPEHAPVAALHATPLAEQHAAVTPRLPRFTGGVLLLATVASFVRWRRAHVYGPGGGCGTTSLVFRAPEVLAAALTHSSLTHCLLGAGTWLLVAASLERTLGTLRLGIVTAALVMGSDLTSMLVGAVRDGHSQSLDCSLGLPALALALSFVDARLSAEAQPRLLPATLLPPVIAAAVVLADWPRTPYVAVAWVMHLAIAAVLGAATALHASHWLPPSQRAAAWLERQVCCRAGCLPAALQARTHFVAVADSYAAQSVAGS